MHSLRKTSTLRPEREPGNETKLRSRGVCGRLAVRTTQTVLLAPAHAASAAHEQAQG